MRRAAERILELLPKALDDGDALALVAAWAGVTGREAMHRIVEQLGHGEIEHRCPRCGARLYVERDGAEVVVRWREERVAVVAGTLDRALVDVVEASSRGSAGLGTALGRVLGPIRCVRCDHVHGLIDAPNATVPSESPRRKDGGDHVIEPTVATAALIRTRLIDIARDRSEDAVRLPGVCLLRVNYYRPYRGINPRTGVPVDVAGKFRLEPCAEPALLALVNERPMRSIVPSDAPELDALAAQVFSACSAHDQVTIRGVCELTVKQVDRRPGFTVDGDPITVPARRRIEFAQDPDLEAVLA